MGCGNEISDWDDKAVQDSLAGKNFELDPKILEETRPEVERTIEERVIECLQENVENAKDMLSERLAQSEPTDIDRLDRGVEPTQEEYREMFKVGKELGITRDLEIIDMPMITGIKDPEKVITEDKIKEAVQKGEIKLADIEKVISQIEQRTQENHIDIETMRALMKETLGFLKDSKIPSEWRDQAMVNMIVFVDKQERIKRGGKEGQVVEAVVKPEKLQEEKHLGRSRNLYMFQNKKGRLLPTNEAERKDFYWRLAHGICHINDPRFRDERAGRFDTRVAENPLEWIRACEAQLKVGVVDKNSEEEVPYSLSDTPPEDRNDPEKVQDSREFRAQHYAAWVTDSPELCPKMKEFFDKYFID